MKKVEKYQDSLLSDEELKGVEIGDYGYKYRVIDGIVFPPYVTSKRIENSLKVSTRPTDVCYCSFPKSGSTWLANILYLILHDGEPAKDATLRSQLHWMESAWSYPRSLEEVDALPSPRIFKSHMPYSKALGGGPQRSPARFIYIARNPKDVCVSYYFFERGKAWSGEYNGPWEHWLNLFMEGKVQRGSWFDHVLSWWAHRDEDNLLFLTYEELKKDFDKELRKIILFLGYDLSDQVIEKIKEASSFERMKVADFSSHQQIGDLESFFRKGEIGSWQEMFTREQNEKFDALYRKKMQDSGLDFDFYGHSQSRITRREP